MRVTLKNRITTSIIIFAVVLISAFAAIQIQNQFYVTTIFNSVRAKLIAEILKDAVQRSLNDPNAQDDMSKALHNSLSLLSQFGPFDAACIYSTDGIIQASTHDMRIGKQATTAELTHIKQAFQGTSSATGMYAYVDKSTRTLTLYIPIKPKGGPFYTGRLDISLGKINPILNLRRRCFKRLYQPPAGQCFEVHLHHLPIGFFDCSVHV